MHPTLLPLLFLFCELCAAPATAVLPVSLLAERSWFEQINSEFAASLLQLGPRFVVRALQHAAAEPLLCVRLYVWASRFGQHFARDRAVRRALRDALWPPALLRSIQDSMPPALPCWSATSRLQLLSSQIPNATTLRQLA
jgi:hypothetical protein